jgi:hypothetical protein
MVVSYLILRVFHTDHINLVGSMQDYIDLGDSIQDYFNSVGLGSIQECINLLDSV